MVPHLIRSRCAASGNRKSNLWLIVMNSWNCSFISLLPVSVLVVPAHIIWSGTQPHRDVVLSRAAAPCKRLHTCQVARIYLAVEWQTDSSFRAPPRHRLSMSLSSLTIHLIRFVFLFPVHWRHSMLSVASQHTELSIPSWLNGDAENWQYNECVCVCRCKMLRWLTPCHTGKGINLLWGRVHWVSFFFVISRLDFSPLQANRKTSFSLHEAF